MSALHNSGINDIISILNTAWPLSVGLGVAGQIGSWDALTAKGTTIPSSSTLVLTTATGPRIDISGATTINAVTLADGTMRFARATGIFQITASASLIVNKSTSVNYTSTVGDILIFQADGSVVSVTILGGPNPLSLSGSSVGYTPFQGISTEGGAAAGPIIDLFRNSPTPANSDLLGEIDWNGANASLAKVLAAGVRARWTPTAGSESVILEFLTVQAGTYTNRMALRTGLIVGSTGLDRGSGTVNASTGYYLADSYGVISIPGAAVTPSGTSVDFTGIPAGAKRITMNFAGLSTSGASAPQVRLGDSGGFEATGYLGSTTGSAAAALTTVTPTTGAQLPSSTWAAANVFSGTVVCTLIDAATFLWSIETFIGLSSTTQTAFGVYQKATSAMTDRIQITTAGGTDTFDATGTPNLINITIE